MNSTSPQRSDSAPLPPAGTRDMAKTVLIVEDNDLSMKLYKDVLEVHGFRTLGTKSGEEALRLARDHHPDLIIMDIQLPETSGLDVTRLIKNDAGTRSIPVVAVTALAVDWVEKRAREEGCEAYLAKPISVTEFMGVVTRFVN